MKLAVYNKEGKETGTIDLPDALFKDKVNSRVLHQAIVMYRASLRQGTAATKPRAKVRGGGRKPFRQKGTGRARQGSTRSPLWVGGGTVFGPTPRDFGYSLSKKIRNAALRESFNAKLKAETVKCLEDLKEPLAKTKEFAQILKNLKVAGKTLALLEGSDASVQRVSKNIAFFDLARCEDVNAYDIMRHKTILVSKSAIEKIIARVK